MNIMPVYRYKHVTDIDLENLKARGIQLIIFDIDNTVSVHGAPILAQGVQEWLETLKDFGFTICFLSNNGRTRVEKLTQVVGNRVYFRAMKPFRYSYMKVLRDFNVTPSQACMVGDQIFTDIWGANRCGICSILVDQLSDHEDVFIKIKRRIEKIFSKG